jgi:hypothetical protein
MSGSRNAPARARPVPGRNRTKVRSAPSASSTSGARNPRRQRTTTTTTPATFIHTATQAAAPRTIAAGRGAMAARRGKRHASLQRRLGRWPMFRRRPTARQVLMKKLGFTEDEDRAAVQVPSSGAVEQTARRPDPSAAQSSTPTLPSLPICSSSPSHAPACLPIKSPSLSCRL